MSTPELKPCPFCGNKEVELYRETPSAYWKVLCYRCDQSGETIEDAAREWNTRHNPAESALNAAREGLKKTEQKQPAESALAQIDPQQSKTT